MGPPDPTARGAPARLRPGPWRRDGGTARAPAGAMHQSRHPATAGAGSPDACGHGPPGAGRRCVGVATWATLRDHPGQSGRSPGAGPLARALRGPRRPLADPASHRDRGLSGSQCPLCGWHSPRRAARHPGRGSVSSGQQPAGSGRGLCARSAPGPPGRRGVYGAGTHAGRRPGGSPAHVPGTPPVLPGLATTAGGSTTAPARRLGRDLRSHSHPPRPGDAGHDDCRAAWDQPSHRICIPAPDPAAESPQSAAVWPGVAAVHGVSDPALAGGVHGQYAALARDTHPRLCTLRTDRLALHHAAAASERPRHCEW